MKAPNARAKLLEITPHKNAWMIDTNTQEEVPETEQEESTQNTGTTVASQLPIQEPHTQDDQLPLYSLDDHSRVAAPSSSVIPPHQDKLKPIKDGMKLKQPSSQSIFDSLSHAYPDPSESPRSPLKRFSYVEVSSVPQQHERSSQPSEEGDSVHGLQTTPQHDEPKVDSEPSHNDAPAPDEEFGVDESMAVDKEVQRTFEEPQHILESIPPPPVVRLSPIPSISPSAFAPYLPSNNLLIHHHVDPPSSQEPIDEFSSPAKQATKPTSQRRFVYRNGVLGDIFPPQNTAEATVADVELQLQKKRDELQQKRDRQILEQYGGARKKARRRLEQDGEGSDLMHAETEEEEDVMKSQKEEEEEDAVKTQKEEEEEEANSQDELQYPRSREMSPPPPPRFQEVAIDSSSDNEREESRPSIEPAYHQRDEEEANFQDVQSSDDDMTPPPPPRTQEDTDDSDDEDERDKDGLSAEAAYQRREEEEENIQDLLEERKQVCVRLLCAILSTHNVVVI